MVTEEQGARQAEEEEAEGEERAASGSPAADSEAAGKCWCTAALRVQAGGG